MLSLELPAGNCRGLTVTGHRHHEIIIPLLAAGILDRIKTYRQPHVPPRYPPSAAMKCYGAFCLSSNLLKNPLLWAVDCFGLHDWELTVK